MSTRKGTRVYPISLALAMPSLSLFAWLSLHYSLTSSLTLFQVSPTQPLFPSNRRMGFFSALQQFLGVGKRTVNIIVVGLDNSGKTTILNSLRNEETKVSQVVPTVGMSVTQFGVPGINFSAFDMSGQGKYRTLWESYYAKAEGIMFVVDSADRLRMSVARDELFMLIDNKETRKCPILIMANKSDLNEALSAAEISTALGLDMIRGRAWHIASTSAVTGSGVQQALEWLSTNVKDYIERRGI